MTTSISEALELGSSAFLTHSLNPNLLPLRTRAGQRLIHNVSARPIGKRPYSKCMLQIADVTSAAHREKVLRERQNARYEAVVESASDVILTLDANGIIQSVNTAAVRETRFERSELVGRSLGELFEQPQQWEDFGVGSFPAAARCVRWSLSRSERMGRGRSSTFPHPVG